MDNFPLISIIVPVYNVETFLRQCLDSIVTQTYKNLEIILVDDGSTDNSGKVCDEYAERDRRIKVIHKSNSGVSSARNVGLNVATGKYIGFVDGDDWIEPDMYEYLLSLCQNFQISIACCEYFENKYRLPFTCPRCFTAREWLAQASAPGSVGLVLFKKDSIGSLRFNTNITIGEDALFKVQAICNTMRLVYGPSTKYHYRFNSNSAMNASFNPKEMSSFQALFSIKKTVSFFDWPEVNKRLGFTIPAEAVRLLNKVIKVNYQGPEIQDLIIILKGYKWAFLIGKTKLSVKLFALMCCINFNLTAKLYHLFMRVKIWAKK